MLTTSTKLSVAKIGSEMVLTATISEDNGATVDGGVVHFRLTDADGAVIHAPHNGSPTTGDGAELRRELAPGRYSCTARFSDESKRFAASSDELKFTVK